MPLTPFQTSILRTISAHRHPDSYIAGGIVLNRRENSPRFSDDIDIFHDTREALALSAQLDAAALRATGHVVTFTKREPAFQRAEVERDGESVRLEWAADSVFRFFPILPDDVLGYRLHDADAATNKVPAGHRPAQSPGFHRPRAARSGLPPARHRRLGGGGQGRGLDPRTHHG